MPAPSAVPNLSSHLECEVCCVCRRKLRCASSFVCILRFIPPCLGVWHRRLQSFLFFCVFLLNRGGITAAVVAVVRCDQQIGCKRILFHYFFFANVASPSFISRARVWIYLGGGGGIRCFCHESLNVHESFLETLAMTTGI